MTFRARLGPHVWAAVLTTAGVYLGIKLIPGLGSGAVAEYAFGCAALAGLAHFAFLVATRHVREGLELDETGLFDLGAGTRIPWHGIEAVRLAVEPHPLKGKQAILRVATVSGPGGSLRFGDLGPAFPARAGDILNLEGAALVLAAVAARTGSQVLFPPSWAAPPPAEGAPVVEQPDAAELERHRANSEERAGIVGALFKLAIKGGAVALKLLKAIKPGAVLLSLAVYSLVFSWQGAVGLVVMIAVHECGHVFAMWREGVEVHGIYLFPFFGGAAVGKGIAGTRRGTAYIALNGPVWGTLLALACLVAFFATGMAHPWLAAAAGWGALINLFNLLPIYPLDGGRVVGSLAHATGRGVFLVFGFLIFGAALAYLQDLELVWLIILIGLFELGPHLAAMPYRAALDAIGDRPFAGDEAEHFDRLVARVIAGSTSEGEKKTRLDRYAYRLQDASQVPMTAGQRLAVLGAYVGLFAVLLAITVVATKVPGSGVHLGILR